MNKLFILAGPTGIGKTDLSVKIAEIINGEIISCDSMQIYKYMDIGSAKVTHEEMKNIPHYLIDFLEPNVNFSVAEYKKLAEEKIREINLRGKIPMLVGGTGLYINSILYNYDFNTTDKDTKYREYLQQLANENGREYVHSLLKNVDIESYKKLYPKDLKRVIRALEVYKTTGKTISQIQEERKKKEVDYDLKYFVLTMDREKLYNRINHRVDKMLYMGLVDEVKKLKKMGYTPDMQSMKGIGYKEILYYLQGKATYDETVNIIKQGSRNYAKRQLTWFRRDKRAIWIDKDKFQTDAEVIAKIIENIEGFF